MNKCYPTYHVNLQTTLILNVFAIPLFFMLLAVLALQFYIENVKYNSRQQIFLNIAAIAMSFASRQINISSF